MHIAICDDDLHTAEHLKYQLLSIADGSVAKVDLFTDANQMLFSMGDALYDIVFMDIRLGTGSGIEFSKKIADTCPGTQIIFVSGYDDYYLDVYDVEHAYFLRKPVDEKRLTHAFQTARQKAAAAESRFLTLSGKNGMLRIPLKEISFLEKSQRLILIHQANGALNKTYGKFTDIADQLGPLFIQCHLSYMVNFRHVVALEKQTFYMKDGQEIPISRTFYKDVKQAFSAYLERRL